MDKRDRKDRQHRGRTGADVPPNGLPATLVIRAEFTGPPKDRNAAIAVLREAVASGVNHIDTSDYYGPHVTNQIIREALYPYPKHLVIVTKIGARRGEDGSWNPAFSSGDLSSAVHDNLRNLGLDVLEVVNFRVTFSDLGPAEGSIEAPLAHLAELQRQGLVRHIGLSNVTPRQVDEGRAIADIICVQNRYNLAYRDDDALIGQLAAAGIAYVPFSRSAALSHCSRRRFQKSPRRLALRPCRWRSPGCSSARQTSC